MVQLTKLYQDSVARFLKTVVCFDDDAYSQRESTPQHPRKASRSNDGFDADVETAAPIAATNDNAQLEEADGKDESTNPHWLDANALTNAFAEREILCSVINPSNDPSQIQSYIEKTARTADVVILDWEMPGKDHKVVQNAIVRIIEADKNEGGCLRLIVIYSAAKGDIAINDLAADLASYDFVKNGDFELRSEHTLIIFLNKPDSLHEQLNQVPYEQLPDRIINEMQKLTSGLLPSTALRAVSSIRDQTHHLVAKFSSGLDGAYIVHRASIPDPNDAETFILDLLSGELSYALTNDKVKETINGIACSLWIEVHDHLNVEEKSYLKKAVTEVAPEDKQERLSHRVKDGPFKGGDDKKIVEKFFSTIYKDEALEKAKADISILSTIDRDWTHPGITDDIPKLKLGSIVIYNGGYLLCIQPLCQSVRISDTTSTPFAFLKLSICTSDSAEGARTKKTSLDICVRDKNKEAVWLSAKTNPNQIVAYNFIASSYQKPYIIAERTENDTYEFRSDNGSFEWCADLRIGKAQRLVSALASQLHTFGIDEFEWLRLHQ